MYNLLHPRSPVNRGRLIELGIDGAQRGNIDDCVKAHILPYIGKHVERLEGRRPRHKIHRLRPEERGNLIKQAVFFIGKQAQHADNYND